MWITKGLACCIVFLHFAKGQWDHQSWNIYEYIYIFIGTRTRPNKTPFLTTWLVYTIFAKQSVCPITSAIYKQASVYLRCVPPVCWTANMWARWIWAEKAHNTYIWGSLTEKNWLGVCTIWAICQNRPAICMVPLPEDEHGIFVFVPHKQMRNTIKNE